MVCYGCFAFFLLLGGLLDAMAGYYPLDTDHILVGIAWGKKRTKLETPNVSGVTPDDSNYL